MQELKKLEAMPPMSAESTVSRNYLDWLLAVPWKKRSKEIRSIEHAEKILNEDHYGLEKIKERILEFLAVRQLVKNPKGSILCFVGPPGVGKTSLGMSIAKATGRKFVRMSLGGVRDEAEIRGHRRTYIGALPGQIIQSMKKAGTKNPVFMLDEIDKMASDFRGDPASALLEVLDPEQNTSFQDHYLDVEYDLSQVLFVATANVLHTIPGRAAGPHGDSAAARLHRDREAGDREAVSGEEAARRHRADRGADQSSRMMRCKAIDPRATRARPAFATWSARSATCAARLRARVVQERPEASRDDHRRRTSSELLGVPKFRDSQVHEKSEIGLVTGLAWTEVGGTILQTEVQVLDGKGKLTATGQLGDVMQESAQAALSYIRSRVASSWAGARTSTATSTFTCTCPRARFRRMGLRRASRSRLALASALTKIKVRRDIAMTGEITLRGKVLPIGGLKEKLLAAHRAGIFEAILPEENRKDWPTCRSC